MNADDWFQLIVYLSVLMLLAIPLGRWMAVVLFAKEHRMLQWQTSVERAFAKVCGFDADEQMTWRRYAAALLLFNALGLIAVYGLQRAQHLLPMNARGLGPVSPDLAFNTAVSFATNTNW